MRVATAFFALTLAFVLSGCDILTPDAPAEEDVLDGTIEGMTPSQVRQHFAGDEEFGRVFSVGEGLGPVFVAASCEQCHAGDGKGHPVFNLQRFGRLLAETGFDPMVELGGPQLQHRSIPGYPAEVVPPGVTGLASFTPPAVTGLGFLDAVPDQTLIDMADPFDLDDDQITGRLQLLEPTPLIEEVIALERRGSPDPMARGRLVDGRYIGRFGKKGVTVNLLHQTVVAYHQDMGITSDLIPEDIFNPAAGSRASDDVADPEVTSAAVANVVFYLKTLRVPPRRNADDPLVRDGEVIFRQIGCADCHVPTLTTGPSEIEVLDRKEFHPYTDLLLHDMGPELDDGYSEGRAATSEWRTAPLWGLGLAASFQGGEMFLLHDGRARSIDEAVEYHGGEAAGSRGAFLGLTMNQRAAIMAFLESL
ncbi:MAG: di-heme oxidoredictase family protein [Longimicrobiales bacterium]|nr:di-heme oxidoredictase family protein [Longimicrobiales bacterium]